MTETAIQPDEALALLRAAPILASLTDDEIQLMAADVRWLRAAPEEAVISHLSEGRHVYFVIEGEFRTTMTTPYGRAVEIGVLRPGSHFGEIAALTGAPRTLSVIANTASFVAECAAETFQKAMRRNARFAEAIAISLARRVAVLTDRLFELATLEMRFRVYSELLRLARTGEAVEDGVLIRNAPTHEKLAATIGAQREAVTRELRHLVSEGIIRQSRRELVVLDIDQLRDIVRRRAGLTATQMVDWES